MTDKSEDKPEAFKRPRRQLTEKDMLRVNVGRSYWASNLAGVQDKEVSAMLFRYCTEIVEMISTGSGLIFDGDIGVGKTSAAVLVLKEAIRRGFTTYFATHDELRELIFEKKVFGTGADGLTVNDKIKSVQLLVIDGVNYPFLVDKGFGPLQLERLLIHRNDRKKATIVTTRIVDELKGKAYKTLWDVMTQSMVGIAVDGDNLRDDARKKLQERVLGE